MCDILFLVICSFLCSYNLSKLTRPHLYVGSKENEDIPLMTFLGKICFYKRL